MRAVVQRTKSAAVTADGETVGRIKRGLAVLVGVGEEDGPDDVDYLARKISGLRVFEDDAGKMNLSVADVDGAVLLVPQFTLYGDCRRGRRPSFDPAAPPDTARRLYENLVQQVRDRNLDVETGEFGSHMELDLVKQTLAHRTPPPNGTPSIISGPSESASRGDAAS